MRRQRRLTLIVGIVIVLLCGVHGAGWLIVAGRIEDGAAGWAEAMRPRGLAIAWKAIRVAGYPFSFRVELTDARIVGTALSPASEFTAPLLSASIRPWNWHNAVLKAPDGLQAKSSGVVELVAGAAVGTVAIGDDGSTAAWLALSDVKAAAAAIPDARATAETAQLWLTVPAMPPQGHTERSIAVAGDFTRLSIPLAPPALGNTVDDLAFGVAVMGTIPPGPPRQAAIAWRDAGGAVEIDHFHLGWGALGIDASGTAALDQDLQPIGSFSGALSGYEELLTALVSTGQIRGSDARSLKLVLGMLAKLGPDGKKRIATAFSLQNGQIFVGPASLGRVPRIPW